MSSHNLKMDFIKLIATLLFMAGIPFTSYSQTNWPDEIKTRIEKGIPTAEDLGTLIFNALQNNIDLAPFYSNRQVFSEMIQATGKKHEETAQAAADYWWNDFQKERETMLNQFYENLKAKNIKISEFMLDDIDAKLSDIPFTNGAVKAADLFIRFRKGDHHHLIYLNDCGMINGRWYIMTPYIFLDPDLKK